MEKLSDRQQMLYEWLQTQHSATMAEIQERFKVSTATAYRDMRALVQAGLTLKTSTGIKLAPSPGTSAPQSEEKCAFCGGEINERTAFVFQLQDGTQRKACCPHCGMLAMERLDVSAALASDFLYGRMINARQATFLLSSSVNLCCEPSVLCFATHEHALLFQLGFGGQICTLEQAAAKVKEIMSIQK